MSHVHLPRQTGTKAMMSLAGLFIAWVWTLLSGGGGLVLLVERGPWPLTNGWFALASGLAACPLTATLVKRAFGFAVSGWTRFGAALFLFVAGHFALWLQGMPYGFRGPGG